MTPVERFSAAFESLPGLTHLNNAGLSPINREAAQVMHSWIERYRTEGMFCNDAYLEAVSVARQDLATFLGASPSQIAFFQSVANAVSQIAFHIGLRPGDEVVMWDQEYGSHLYPWQAACHRTGAELRLVPSGDQLSTPAERLIASVNERTRVIAISWVQFQTGAVCDLEKIVRAIQGRPIRLVVDAFQGLGILPFSFAESGVDALVAGSHKWMTSAVGVGYLCLKEEFAASLAPHNVGSYTYGTCDDPTQLNCEPKRDALRFEAGSKQVLEILSLGASARLLHHSGVRDIGRYACELAQNLADGAQALGYQVIQSNGPRQQTPHVNLVTTDRSPYPQVPFLVEALKHARISFAVRGPGLRFSPHAHNSPEDIQRCLAVLDRSLEVS